MRRFIAILLVCILFLSNFVLAETFDFASITTDELLKIKQALDAELTARNVTPSSTIVEGMYTTGKSIKAGSYKITCLESYGSNGYTIQTFASEDDYASYEIGMQYGLGNALLSAYLVYSDSLEVGQSATVQLTDGMVLLLADGIASIEVSNAFWMP